MSPAWMSASSAAVITQSVSARIEARRSYGVNNVDLFVQVGPYIDRILKGAKPSDLPVQQPSRFQLVINMKTAKALNLSVSPSLQATADEVIE